MSFFCDKMKSVYQKKYLFENLPGVRDCYMIVVISN